MAAVNGLEASAVTLTEDEAGVVHGHVDGQHVASGSLIDVVAATAVASAGYARARLGDNP